MKVHLILVAHGAAARCKSALGGSGSLMIMPETIGSGALPFAVGRVGASKKYIHILDDTSLDILLTTLDTVADLVAYLERKEAFIETGRLGAAAGEEELLAFYLADINERDEHDFIIKADVDRVMIDEGHWAAFSRSEQRRRQIEANEISYAWDVLIEHFNNHFSGGRLEYTSDTTVVSHEKLMRYFARESRTGRPVLARTLFSLIETTPAHLRRTHVIQPNRPSDPHYVFLLVPWRKDRPYEENATQDRPPGVSSVAFRAPSPGLRFASLMDMGFAVSRPLARRSRLLPGFCPSTRTFALRFLQTSPRGNSPCVVANPSPPSGWVEDFHLQAAEHAQHTTKPLRGSW